MTGFAAIPGLPDGMIVGKPQLKDQADWIARLEFIAALAKLGSVARWATSQNSMYENMPKIFNIEGVLVEFLPHWGFYTVGGINLSLPINGVENAEESVRTAVNAVKALISVGYKPTVKP